MSQIMHVIYVIRGKRYDARVRVETTIQIEMGMEISDNLAETHGVPRREVFIQRVGPDTYVPIPPAQQPSPVPPPQWAQTASRSNNDAPSMNG